MAKWARRPSAPKVSNTAHQARVVYSRWGMRPWEWGRRASLTPCCQLIAPHSSVMRTDCTFVGNIGMRSSVSAEGGAGRASSKLGAAATRGWKAWMKETSTEVSRAEVADTQSQDVCWASGSSHAWSRLPLNFYVQWVSNFFCLKENEMKGTGSKIFLFIYLDFVSPGIKYPYRKVHKS